MLEADEARASLADLAEVTGLSVSGVRDTLRRRTAEAAERAEAEE